MGVIVGIAVFLCEYVFPNWCRIHDRDGRPDPEDPAEMFLIFRMPNDPNNPLPELNYPYPISSDVFLSQDFRFFPYTLLGF